ncbi:hypothetical protein [Arthrobacter castelli]|uniref:hypothetical protein n=1 Tax=Arthrobacter castelli TaxID=271431 RepID=UPI0003F9C6C7|nr:hypothetical protein [Arthrobacter castelli]
MASDSESNRISPAAARESLAGLDADRSRLAGRMVTPWWYYPALGLITVLLVTAPALDGTMASILMAIVVIAAVTVPSIHARLHGVRISGPAGKGTRTIGFSLAGIVVVLMLASLSINIFDIPTWWALLPAMGAFLAVALLGPRYDRHLRRELGERTGARP